MKRRHPHIPGRRRGFTIAEAVMAIVIVGGLLVAALNGVAVSRTGRGRAADHARGQQLALDLMAEILQQAYQDPVQTPVFGLEPGESSTSRAAWNDVDDYNGWTETPPKTKSGTVMNEAAGWTRSVAVQWVDPTTLATSSTLTNTGIKKITVTVKKGTITMATIAAYRTVGWVDTIPKPTDATGNHPPTAVAAGTPLTGGHGSLAVTFNGTGSSDYDGDALTYVWNFGDNTTGNGVAISHTYNAAGTYNATLTVYDGRGGVGISTVTVVVSP